MILRWPPFEKHLSDMIILHLPLRERLPKAPDSSLELSMVGPLRLSGDQKTVSFTFIIQMKSNHT